MSKGRWFWRHVDLETYNEKTGKYDKPSKNKWLVSPGGERIEVIDIKPKLIKYIVACLNHSEAEREADKAIEDLEAKP